MKRSALTRLPLRLTLAFFLSVLTLPVCALAAALDLTLNEQVVMLPVNDNGSRLQFETTIFRPPGNGPFPLLLMNHGKERGSPGLQKRDRFLSMSREFVKRGYAVVVPMRKGFSQSTGGYSDYGCNMKDNGQLQANDIEAALAELVQQPWVDPARIVIAGQSYGGLATMAFGTRNFPGVRGLLNFAGGLRIDGGNCNWRASLVTAFADYAARTVLPSLWFYGANDSYFNQPLANKLAQAYQAAGGRAQLVAFGNFKSDAHGMVGSRDGVAIWWPETERFLQTIGMPTAQVVALASPPKPATTNFAAIDNIAAVPYLSDAGRQAYRSFLGKSAPRAFALSATGQWSWAEEGDDPAERVLTACQQSSRSACRLYAVDQDVVWSEEINQPQQMQQASGN
jgi:dienelactone hydrolase